MEVVSLAAMIGSEGATVTRVPDDIMSRLHAANERFHEARLRLTAAGDMGLTAQRDASRAVCAAEQGLEEITREIDAVLHDGQATHPDGRIEAEQVRPTGYGHGSRATVGDIRQPPGGGGPLGTPRLTSAAADGRSGRAIAKDVFHDRERAEEAAYFSQQDARLIEKLRERARLGEIAGALAEKLKVDDPTLLERIIKLGVTIDTGAAFILAPLVEIAWADGRVDGAERRAVLRLARDRGVAPDSADMNQLLQWMAVRPPDGLFQAALEAIKVGISVLPRDEAEQRITRMIEACEQVAESSGGLGKLLRLHGGASTEERSVLQEISARLTATRAVSGEGL